MSGKNISADTGFAATTVILFSSSPCEDPVKWREKFERFSSTAGWAIRILTHGSADGAWSDTLPENESPAILWDIAAGVPPKEMEKLVSEFTAGQCRVGVRHVGSPLSCGVAGWKRVCGRWVGRIRRVLGKISDPHPPCVAASVTTLKRLSSRLMSVSEKDWTLTFAESAMKDGGRVIEVPVMWSAAKSSVVSSAVSAIRGR